MWVCTAGPPPTATPTKTNSLALADVYLVTMKSMSKEIPNTYFIQVRPAPLNPGLAGDDHKDTVSLFPLFKEMAAWRAR